MWLLLNGSFFVKVKKLACVCYNFKTLLATTIHDIITIDFQTWYVRGEKKCIQGFGGETWGKEPTWKT